MPAAQFADLELTPEEQKALTEANPEPAAEPDTPAEEIPQEQPVAEPVSREALPRDDKGRFAPEPDPAKPAQTVPLATLIEERRAYQQKLDERDKLLMRGNERVEQLLQRFAAPKEPPKPTIEDAPLDVLRDVQQRQARIEEANQQQVQAQQFAAHVATQVDSFKAQQPDYDAAYGFVKQARGRQLKAMGVPDSQIAMQIAQDEFGVAAQAVQSGQNPAQVIYALAATYGYQPPQAQQAAAQPDRLAMQQQGMAASKSLSNAGGGGAPVKLSLQTLAEMPEAEFAALSEEQIQRIMRGG